MRQNSRSIFINNIFIKAPIYIFIITLLAFTFNSLVISKKANGETNLLAPTLTATKTAVPDTTNTPTAGDVNGNGLVNPGDRLTYTISIPNSGPDAAADVNLIDPIDANTTLLNNSVIASPIAVNDIYSSIGNVGITVTDGANDLLSNDLDANNTGINTALVITNAPTTSAQGGQVSINTTTGAFTYNPPPGYEGSDSFSYTLSNGTGLTDTATVSITVSGMIWFVKNDAPACTALAAGCGRLSNPISSLAAFQALNNNAGNNPANNDSIFIYTGNAGYDGSITLSSGQKLIGAGATAALAGAGSVTGITIPAFSNALPATNGTNPIVITTAAATNAINFSGSNNTIRGITIGNTTGSKLNASVNVGTLTIGPTTGTSDVTLTGNGQAINLTGGGILAARFASISSTNANQAATTTGITLTGFAGNLVSPTTTITNPNGAGINISNSGSNAGFDFGNTQINQSGGTGINLSSNVASFTFADLDIAPDSGQRGFHSTNGSGAITIGTGSTVTTTNNTAIDVVGTSAANTTPINIQFTSVSANGGANGIFLSNTSSAGSPGGFRIHGNGGTCSTVANCTGGAIQSSTGSGIHLNNASNISITRVALFNNLGNGIFGSNVTNFSLNASRIHGNGNADIDNEGGIHFTNLFGNAAVDGTEISNSYEDTMRVMNSSGTLSSLSITNSIFRDNSTGSPGNDGLLVEASGTANITANVTNSQFLRHRAKGIQVQNIGSGSVVFHIGSSGAAGSGGTFQDNDVAVSFEGGFGSGNGTFTGSLRHAAMTYPTKSAAASPVQVNMGTSSVVSSTMNAVIANNSVTTSPSSTGPGIFVKGNGAGTMGVTIESNTVTQVGDNYGINIIARDGSNKVNARVASNTVNVNGTFGSAIRIDSAALSTDTTQVCLDIVSNDAETAAPSDPLNGRGITIRQRLANSRFFLEGFNDTDDGSAGQSVPAENYVKGNNSLTSTVYADGSTTERFENSPGCVTPAVIAPLSEEVEGNTTESFDTKPDFLSSSQQSQFDDSEDIQPLFKHLSNLEILSRAKASEAEAKVQAEETVPASEAVNAQNASLQAKNSTFFSNASYILSEFAGKIGSVITPTVYAQEINKLKTERFAPQSGETINKQLGTIPAGEQIVVQFKATIDASIPSNNYFVSNQATISGSNFSSIQTDGDTVTTGNQPTLTTVVQPPSISKAFGVANIAVDGVTTLTFTVTNGNVGQAYSNLSFSDTLPSGLVINTPNGLTNSCNGTVTATQNTNLINLSNGSLNAPVTAGTTTSCTVKVDVKGTTEGAKNNLSDAVSSLEGGTGNSAAAVLNVIAAPSFAKAFGAASIQLNASTTLTFTITNNSSVFPLNNVSFTDTLPAGLVVSDNPNITGSCGAGTITANAGANSISLSGTQMGFSSVCVIGVSVTGTTAGVKNNSVQLSTTELGAGATATASVTVIAPATIAKQFSPATMSRGGQSVVTLTLTNPNTTEALTNASLTDVLTNMTAEGGAVGGTCQGTSPNNLASGATNLSFSGITIPNNGSCTVTFAVTSSTAGLHPNTTSGITSTQTPVAGAVSNTANLTVVGAPIIAKSFSPDTVAVNQTSTLTITITNPVANTAALTGVAVTDNFPQGMQVDSTPQSTNSCPAGSTFTPAASANNVSISGVTVPVNGTCTFTVKVKGTATGTLVNTTGPVTSANGGAGNAASATLTVTQPSIGGTVSYGIVITGNPVKYVSGVLMSATGASDVSVNTDNAGAYLMNNLTSGGNYTVTPTKTANVNGITAFDATLVLRCVAANNNCTLTPNQRIAADTDGDNSVTPFDATQILRFVAANGPNANTGQVGSWKFDPINRPYSALNSIQTGQDYTAILIGEIDGDWMP